MRNDRRPGPPPQVVTPLIGDPEVRVAVLAIALMLKDRADCWPVTQGADIERVQAEYFRVGRLHAKLGRVEPSEMAQAMALWDETADI